MKTMLKKENVKKYMYIGKFPNKELFWKDLLEKREKRSNNKPIDRIWEKPYLPSRYENKIKKCNFQKIENIIIETVGLPSFYHFIYYAGNVNKSNYSGSYLGNSYSSKCSWRKKYHKFNIYAPRQITIEVERFDNLNNVYCKKIKSLGNIDIYKASWIVKKRGYNFVIESGFVAYNSINGVSYHEFTVKKAIKGLERKIKAGIKATLTENTILNLKKFQKLTGACTPGCLQFMNSHNILENTKMTVLEAIKLLNNNNQSYYADKLKNAIK